MYLQIKTVELKYSHCTHTQTCNHEVIHVLISLIVAVGESSHSTPLTYTML